MLPSTLGFARGCLCVHACMPSCMCGSAHTVRASVLIAGHPFVPSWVRGNAVRFSDTCVQRLCCAHTRLHLSIHFCPVGSEGMLPVFLAPVFEGSFAYARPAVVMCVHTCTLAYTYLCVCVFLCIPVYVHIHSRACICKRRCGGWGGGGWVITWLVCISQVDISGGRLMAV